MKDVKKRLARMGLVFCFAPFAGCGGSAIQVNFLLQGGSLSDSDPKMSGRYFYDTWTFVPNKTDRA
ncbi:MAG: hypothetical protein ACHQ50_14860, partial [Fimbriimonadales bacterium]